MLMRWAHLTMRGNLRFLAVGVFVISTAAVSGAQTTATDVCVIMTGSNGQVSGLQLDLGWDPACMTAERGSVDTVKCAANPATGKSVQTKLFPNNSTLRALFLSVSDTSPVPDDELFCCRFTLNDAQANPCCVARIDNLILANPNAPGGRIYDAGISVQALVGNTPCTASAPGGSPSNPVRPPLPAAVAPIAPAPVVSAPGAEPAPAPVPVQPGPNPRTDSGTGQGPVTSGHVPAAAGPAVVLPGEVPPARGPIPPLEAESTPVPAVVYPTSDVAASVTPRRTATAQRTPTAGTPTPAGTPQAQGTGTPATVGSVTPSALTPTTQPTAKHRKTATP